MSFRDSNDFAPFIEALEGAGLVWVATDGLSIHEGFGGQRGFCVTPDDADAIARRLREAAAQVRDA